MRTAETTRGGGSTTIRMAFAGALAMKSHRWTATIRLTPGVFLHVEVGGFGLSVRYQKRAEAALPPANCGEKTRELSAPSAVVQH